MKTLITLSLILIGMLGTPRLLVAQEQHATAELIANVSAMKPGEPFVIGVRFKIDPDWHIYWTNPGDSGLPTEVKLNLPPGFVAGPVQYPVPKRLQLPGDVINYAYENEVMLMVPVVPPKDLAEKSVSIGAKVSWLVCKDECLPGGCKLSLNLAVGDALAPDNVDLFKTWTSRVPVAATASPDVQAVETAFKKGGKTDADHASLTIRWSNPPTATSPGVIYYLPDVLKAGDVSNIQVASAGSTTSITFAVKGETENEPMPGLIIYTNKSGQLVGISSTVTASESKGR